MLYAILEVYGPQDPEFAANKIEADSELEALAKYAIDQGFADPRESFTKEDLIALGNSGYFYMTDGGVRMIFTNTELRAVPVPDTKKAGWLTVDIGRGVLMNLQNSLPSEINSATDGFDMLEVLLEQARSLSQALYGYDVITEAADAAMTLADIDEGENVDVDRLHKIAEILKSS